MDLILTEIPKGVYFEPLKYMYSSYVLEVTGKFNISYYEATLKSGCNYVVLRYNATYIGFLSYFVVNNKVVWQNTYLKPKYRRYTKEITPRLEKYLSDKGDTLVVQPDNKIVAKFLSFIGYRKVKGV